MLFISHTVLENTFAGGLPIPKVFGFSFALPKELQCPIIRAPLHSPNRQRRIEQFRNAARALLAVYEPAGQGGCAPAARPSPDSPGETRCYYFSPGAVQHERKLLEHYHAEDFRGLLAQTYMLLAGVVKIMKSTHHDVRVKGDAIASLGCLLEQTCSLVLRMRNVYDRVERVRP